MKIYVFTGPTLGHEEARRELDAEFLPPVSEGDVYRVALRQPRAIGIIDGYFERIPAVWHKEILWALAHGIHVYGSASMGALRAAELAPFGMEGVGEIFEAYRDGRLEDDDEVALAHGPPEAGYLAQSEPMVNIRATLRAAEGAQIISHPACLMLDRLAKGLFYPDRIYPLILRLGAESGIASSEIEALRDWLRENSINQKREDALQMLRLMRGQLATDPGPRQVSFTFEHTTYWDRASRLAAIGGTGAIEDDREIGLDALLDELRLDGNAFTRAFESALLRELVLDHATSQRWKPSGEAVLAWADAFRRNHGLEDGEAFKHWLVEQQLTPEDAARLMHEGVQFGWAIEHLGNAALHRLPDHLRMTGQYQERWARAREKRRVLREHGLQNAGLGDAGVSEEALLAWHFAHLDRPVPDDLAGYSGSLGFDDETAFMAAVLREWCYVRLTG